MGLKHLWEEEEEGLMKRAFGTQVECWFWGDEHMRSEKEVRISVLSGLLGDVCWSRTTHTDIFPFGNYSVNCGLGKGLMGLSLGSFSTLLVDGRSHDSCSWLCPGCSCWRRHGLRWGTGSSRVGFGHVLGRWHIRREAGSWRRTGRPSAGIW